MARASCRCRHRTIRDDDDFTICEELYSAERIDAGKGPLSISAIALLFRNVRGPLSVMCFLLGHCACSVQAVPAYMNTLRDEMYRKLDLLDSMIQECEACIPPLGEWWRMNTEIALRVFV